MSEFETRFSGMKQAADQEKRLASEVTEIESEVRNVMNNLQIRSSAMAEIKRKLNGNLQNVSNCKTETSGSFQCTGRNHGSVSEC